MYFSKSDSDISKVVAVEKTDEARPVLTQEARIMAAAPKRIIVVFFIINEYEFGL
jgi:hypothetical protein